MGLLRFAYVVSFSSQDDVHTVENVLQNSVSPLHEGKKRWLCSPNDKSGKLEAEFQLEQVSLIHFIDIGNYGSAMVEIKVGSSSWPRDREYVTLLPAVSMMTMSESKAGTGKTSVRMFSEVHMNQEAVNQKWDRVRVICTQPYKKDAQFGLSFLRISNKTGHPKNTDHVLLVGSPSTSSLMNNSHNNNILARSRSPLIQKKVENYENLCRTNPREIIKSPISRTEKVVHAAKTRHKITPNKPTTDKPKNLEFQEEVNRFLTLQNVDFAELNLDDLCIAMGKWRQKSLNQYERYHLCKTVQQICGNVHPLVAYKSFNNFQRNNNNQGTSTSPKLNDTNGEMSSFIQDFSCHPVTSNSSLQNKFNASRPPESSDSKHDIKKDQYVPRQLPVFDLISSDEDSYDIPEPPSLLKCDIDSETSVTRDAVETIDIPDSDEDFPIVSSTNMISHENCVECPVCSKSFPVETIEAHASECNISLDSDNEDGNSSNIIHSNSSANPLVECPVCGDFFSKSEIATHADQCAEQQCM